MGGQEVFPQPEGDIHAGKNDSRECIEKQSVPDPDGREANSSKEQDV